MLSTRMTMDPNAIEIEAGNTRFATLHTRNTGWYVEFHERVVSDRQLKEVDAIIEQEKERRRRFPLAR